jgi:Uma2 family endonuclease
MSRSRYETSQRPRLRLADTGGVDSPVEGWTIADLELMPDDGRRYEIIDGSLVVSPSPTILHQRVVRWLVDALLAGKPDGFDVLENVGVGLSGEDDRYLIPDACAVRSANSILDEDRAVLNPRDVPLVVEVVSRSSASMDRELKPKLYAQAEIPSFWRVESGGDSIAVHVFRLSGGAYEQVRVVSSGETATLDDPWPVTLTPPGR